MQEVGETVEHPIRTLFRKHLRVLLISFGACMLNAVGFYAVLTYLPNYLETTLNYPAGDASTITTIVLIVYIGFIFLSGRISDKIGRKYIADSLAIAADTGIIESPDAVDLPLTLVGAVIGTHVGPDGVAFAFFARG